MIDLKCSVIQSPRVRRALPKIGQQVRVSVLNQIELWHGSRRVQHDEGEVYHGVVAAITKDGLLDLLIDDGQQLRIYARDTAFEIESFE